MFANDGILSKGLVLILIRVYRQRPVWHSAGTDFINNKKSRWKKIGRTGIFEATDYCNRSIDFPKCDQLWTMTLLSKMCWQNSQRFWPQLWGSVVDFLLGNRAVSTAQDDKGYKEQRSEHIFVQKWYLSDLKKLQRWSISETKKRKEYLKVVFSFGKNWMYLPCFPENKPNWAFQYMR